MLTTFRIRCWDRYEVARSAAVNNTVVYRQYKRYIIVGDVRDGGHARSVYENRFSRWKPVELLEPHLRVDVSVFKLITGCGERYYFKALS